jgi:hypothetical protein
MPAWIEPPDGGEPVRVFAALWVSLSTGRTAVELEAARDAHGPELVLAGLLRFARQEKKVLGGRAGRLQVADAVTRDYLEQALGDDTVHVEVVPRRDVLRVDSRRRLVHTGFLGPCRGFRRGSQGQEIWRLPWTTKRCS